MFRWPIPITTWRVTSLASTGARSARFIDGPNSGVFQDFFVDLDLPVSLTEGDVVSVPVAVYNYLPKAQKVSLELRQDPWFALDNDNAVKQVDVGAGEGSSSFFPSGRLQRSESSSCKLWLDWWTRLRIKRATQLPAQ